MLVVRCANGVVGFRIRWDKLNDQLVFHCLNDGSEVTSARSDAGIVQGLTDMATKAVQLRGAISWVSDIAEVA